MTKYYLIEWPESQYYMDREDCFLVDNENLGSSTYTVPCDIYDGEHTNPLSI